MTTIRLPRTRLATPMRVNTPDIRTQIQASQAQAQAAQQVAGAIAAWSEQRSKVQEAAQINQANVLIGISEQEFDKNLLDNQTVEVTDEKDGKTVVPIWETTKTGETYADQTYNGWAMKLRDEVNNVATQSGAREKINPQLELFLLKKKDEVEAKAREWFVSGMRERTAYEAGKLVDAGQYDQAIATYERQNVLYKKDELAKIKQDLRERRDFMGLFNTIRTVDSHDAVSGAVEALNQAPSTLSPAQIQGLWSDLDSRIVDLDKELDDREKEQNDAVFTNAVVGITNGELKLQDVETLRNQVEASQFKTLMGMADTLSQRGKDDVNAERRLSSEIAGATDDNREQIRSMIYAEMTGTHPVTGEEYQRTLTPGTGFTLLQKLDSTTDKQFSDRKYAAAMSYAQSIIMGTSATSKFSFLPAETDQGQAINLENFRIALQDHVAEKGPDADPIGWARANVWTFATKDDMKEVHSSEIENNIKILNARIKRGDIDKATYMTRYDQLQEALRVRKGQEGQK